MERGVGSRWSLLIRYLMGSGGPTGGDIGTASQITSAHPALRSLEAPAHWLVGLSRSAPNK
jgi:hypothetical protein